MSGKGTIYFPLRDVITLVDSVLRAPAVIPSWLDPTTGKPSLVWVKDDGTYLMTNAERGDGERATVVYGAASPDGPKLDGSQWDLCREICGGDDFGEYVDVDAGYLRSLMRAEAQGARWWTLTVDGDSFTISVDLPPQQTLPTWRQITAAELRVGDVIGWNSSVTDVTPSATGKMISYTVQHGTGSVTSTHRSRATSRVQVRVTR